MATTATQVIKWIVLPNGLDGSSNLKLSIFVAPELTGDPSDSNYGTIAEFPDFVDWPQTIASATYSLTFEQKAPNRAKITVPGTVATAVPLNSQLWTALFPSSQHYVARSVATNAPTNLDVISYPAKQLGDFLTGQYASLSPTSPPTIDEANATYKPISSGAGGVSTAARFARYAAERRASPLGANDYSGSDPGDAVAHHSFYFSPPPPPPSYVPPVPGVSAPLDFHSALTFIGQHGILQRHLGLVIDLTVPLSSFPNTWQGTTELYVYLPPTGPGGTFGAGVNYYPICPPTRVNLVLTGTPAFDAWAEVGSTKLPVNSGHLSVGLTGVAYAHHFDLDGGAIRARNFADGIDTTKAPVAGDGSTPVSSTEPLGYNWPPPALTSNGVTLALNARSLIISDGFQRQAELFANYVPPKPHYAAPPLLPVYAGDTVRGLILDIYDVARGKWYSTNKRVVQYSSPNSAFTTFSGVDEACHSAPPKLVPDAKGKPTYFVSETILHYNNWSNAAPRPGKPLPNSQSLPTVNPANPAEIFGDRIAIFVRPVDQSLPRLRFGNQYHLRARVVDLANNVVPVDAAISLGGDLTLGPIVYGRLDPIPAPDVYAQNGAPHQYPITGEGLRRLVIRDTDVTARLVASTRVLAPPRCTVTLAENHGLFDTAAPAYSGATPGLDQNAYGVFTAPVSAPNVGATRETGQYPPPPQSYPNPQTTPSAPQTIDVSAAVPYLPDPLARGGALSTVPYAGGIYVSDAEKAILPVFFDFSSTFRHAVIASGEPVWPDYFPVKLSVIPTQGARSAAYDSAQRTVTVALQPADVIHTALSCAFNEADVGKYGLGQYLPGIDTPDGLTAAADGKYWGITPFVELELMYTVQRPLHPPEFIAELGIGGQPSAPAMKATRMNVGDTDARLEGQVSWSPNSTSKMDFFASWQEPVDDPNAPSNTSSWAPSVPGVIAGPGVPQPELRHLPGPSDVHVFTWPGGPSEPVEDAISGFISTGKEIAQITDDFANVKHQFHDTKAHLVTYYAVATSRFTSFYPELTDDAEFQVRTQSAIQVQVPSSARPATLHVAYVVPIYDWQGMLPSRGAITTGRSRAGLRVYFERPWWSSGEGELLGVLTSPKARGAERDEAHASRGSAHAAHGASAHAGRAQGHNRKHRRARSKRLRHGPAADSSPIGSPEDHYVSDWGLDPLFAGGPLPSPHPSPAHFTAAVPPPVPGGNLELSIEESDTIRVDVAGHTAQFDPTRNLWYSDIEVDIGSAYTPMIRLALARYQPNSYSQQGVDVALGRVVLADVMTLDPGRTLTVTRSALGRKVDVTLSGHSYSKVAGTYGPGDRVAVPGIMQVLLQVRSADIADFDVGWEVADVPGNPWTAEGALAADGTATWSAHRIPIPGSSQCRLLVLQYEVIPTDHRGRETVSDPYGTNDPNLGKPEPGYRLLYQDIVPLKDLFP
jgi:hypothetical protein